MNWRITWLGAYRRDKRRSLSRKRLFLSFGEFMKGMPERRYDRKSESNATEHFCLHPSSSVAIDVPLSRSVKHGSGHADYHVSRSNLPDPDGLRKGLSLLQNYYLPEKSSVKKSMKSSPKAPNSTSSPETEPRAKPY